MLVLKKYGLAIYLLLTISMVYSLSPISSYETLLNYSLIALGFLFGVIYKDIVFSTKSVFLFHIIWMYLLINVIYQLSFGWIDFKFDDVLYLLSKTSFIFILCLSILKNANFYFTRFYFYLSIFISILFVFGYLFDQNTAGGRSYLGFGNPNSAGALAAIGFGIVLLHPEFKVTLRRICLLILLSSVLLTGSRSAIIIALLSLVFSFRLNIRTLSLGFLILIITYNLNSQFNIAGVNRFISSVESENGLVTNREAEFELGILMFKNKFLTGYGLTGYKIIDKSIAPRYMDEVLGTHNGYIAAAKMYGIFFLFLFIFTILIRPLMLIKKLRKVKNPYLKVHLFVVLSVLIGANAEDYIVGVNSVVTVFFFLSLGVIEMYSKIGQKSLTL